jgi:flagellin-like protein
MSSKSVLKSKKAISPILATLLLIGLVVAAVAVTYAWIMTYVGSTTQQTSVVLYKANVNFYTDGVGIRKIDVDVGDSGNAGTQILQVCVGISSFSVQSQTITPTVPVLIAAGSVVSVTFTYNWAAGEIYYFKVVPTAGQQVLSFKEQAPR